MEENDLPGGLRKVEFQVLVIIYLNIVYKY